jgi:hypothetical protein
MKPAGYINVKTWAAANGKTAVSAYHAIKRGKIRVRHVCVRKGIILLASTPWPPEGKHGRPKGSKNKAKVAL